MPWNDLCQQLNTSPNNVIIETDDYRLEGILLRGQSKTTTPNSLVIMAHGRQDQVAPLSGITTDRQISFAAPIGNRLFRPENKSKDQETIERESCWIRHKVEQSKLIQTQSQPCVIPNLYIGVHMAYELTTSIKPMQDALAHGHDIFIPTELAFKQTLVTEYNQKKTQKLTISGEPKFITKKDKKIPIMKPGIYSSTGKFDSRMQQYNDHKIPLADVINQLTTYEHILMCTCRSPWRPISNDHATSYESLEEETHPATFGEFDNIYSVDGSLSSGIETTISIVPNHLFMIEQKVQTSISFNA
ncbi:hypothetical protein L3V82_10940 [Thiotrichales bacterium 19S3-7]|nr:hypothetical protein [Thiotrichales bacterium 19S3-7]MCF6802696.1 hypothetical protein [Thiotrichales bacterium 19S3-11]